MVVPNLSWIASEVDPQGAVTLLRRLRDLPIAGRPLTGEILKACGRKLSALCAAYVSQPNLHNLLLIMCFQSIALTPTTTFYRSRAIIQRINQYPLVPWPDPPKPNSASIRTAQSIALSHIKKGFLRRAAQSIRNKSSPAIVDEALHAKLRSLHPCGGYQPLTDRIEHSGPKISEADMMHSIERTRFDVAGGPSGWTASFLKSVAKNCKPLITFLTFLCNQISQGTAPRREILCASRLIPLAKSTNVRPIAVGDLFYALCSKSNLLNCRVVGDLHPNQFGFGVSSGTEVITFAIDALRRQRSSGYLATIDISNAFNTIRRTKLAQAIRDQNPQLLRCARWIYGNPSLLFYRSNNDVFTIESAEGVRQGDPLSAYFFSLALRETIQRKQALAISHNGAAWSYLDDIFMVADDDCLIMQELNLILISSETGLKLNSSKSKLVPLTSIEETGVKILGSRIGGFEPRRSFLEAKICGIENLLNRSRNLPKQAQLLLLLRCFAPSLTYLLRTLEPTDLEATWAKATNLLVNATARPSDLGSLSSESTAIALLPSRLGGLGLIDFVNLAPIARKASIDNCRHVLLKTPIQMSQRI